ncbi:protein IQ-DOMAIN 1-like [Dioscorea cayenensis subsp. rotundata]|uniref:Protein IQ-DOMAIN 1-like n=1 Tax=Dioscorea cayennensis subsp. rotundata TaxID=55577 RepID=A0AB40BG41_DIOCR|nr:protein IQ-DOMAIN 1-like [Dioscorea cayenensis subsp. rotundata]XP_039126275.1 protein IQ-DOMAIN 1-like [Dioscorea cayenensis subsp. rotundata]
MGSGDWFKTIINRKRSKHGKPKQVKGSASDKTNGLKLKKHSHKGFNSLYRAVSSVNPEDGITIEDIAATRIQNAFRRFKARKTLQSLKGAKRLQILSQTHPVKKQGSTALNYIQSWSKIQSEIRARRACMVAEGRIKQKKLDNQLKLEAKLHDLQVEWCGGSDTMEEILARIQQREEAAVKRERAMAYAFSHQWRANQGQGPLVYEVGKGSWGWSWMERWIAARPWESRLPYQSVSPNKSQKKAGGNKVAKNTNSATRVSNSVKPSASNGKGAANKKISESSDEKPANQEPNPKPVILRPKAKNGTMMQDQQLQPQASDNAG